MINIYGPQGQYLLSFSKLRNIYECKIFSIKVPYELISYFVTLKPNVRVLLLFYKMVLKKCLLHCDLNIELFISKLLNTLDYLGLNYFLFAHFTL